MAVGVLTVLAVDDKVLLTPLPLRLGVDFVGDGLERAISECGRREGLTHGEKLETENGKKRDEKKERLKEKEKEIIRYLLWARTTMARWRILGASLC